MFPLEPAVIFKIPESDLSLFTVAALTTMSSQATTEYNTLRESVLADESLQTDGNIETLEALKAFQAAAKAEIDGRGAKGNRLATLPELAEPVETVEPITAAVETPTEFAAPTIAQLAPHVPALEGEVLAAEKPVYGRMFAAANVEGFVADSELKDLKSLAKAFISKTASFASMAAMGAGGSGDPIHYQVAYLTRDYPEEFSVYDREEDDAVLAKVVDEYRLAPGGLLEAVERSRQELAETNPLRDGLVAAVGWCAPSETLYDTCFQGVIDGLLDVPEVQARRGGIRHNQGIDFTGVFGGGVGFFNLTEAQVISGTTKTCIEIPCPEFVDDRLGVTGLCITGNILQNRGYPEFVALWMRAAMVASAHQINSLQIAAVVAGSTAVVLASPNFLSDGSVASQVMAAIELAIVDMKYRLRMSRAATLEVVLPWWLLAQFRADFSRRNGGDYMANMNLADSQIVSWFTTRGARAQWVLDWQDAFAPTDLVSPPAQGGPGAATAIQSFPGGVKFLVYPAGTWVRAVSDVITLSAIYDSTKLVTNQLTQLFTETGWAMMRMCPLSRVYTVPICPSGSTGAQREVTCAVV